MSNRDSSNGMFIINFIETQLHSRLQIIEINHVFIEFLAISVFCLDSVMRLKHVPIYSVPSKGGGYAIGAGSYLLTFVVRFVLAVMKAGPCCQISRNVNLLLLRH
jgi:hypothetical protein